MITLALGGGEFSLGFMWCLLQRREVAVLFSWGMGSGALGQSLHAEFRRLQVMAGASKCGEAMWIVRRRRGLRQKAGEVAAVADRSGKSQ